MPPPKRTGAGNNDGDRSVRDLELFRLQRRTRDNDVALVASTEDWLDIIEDLKLDMGRVLDLAFFRQIVSDLMERAEAAPETASATDRAIFVSVIARAQAAWERLCMLSVDADVVREAVAVMRARARAALPSGAPVRRLLKAALETDYIPAMMAALEAAFALDCDELDP